MTRGSCCVTRGSRCVTHGSRCEILDLCRKSYLFCCVTETLRSLYLFICCDICGTGLQTQPGCCQSREFRSRTSSVHRRDPGSAHPIPVIRSINRECRSTQHGVSAPESPIHSNSLLGDDVLRLIERANLGSCCITGGSRGQTQRSCCEISGSRCEWLGTRCRPWLLYNTVEDPEEIHAPLGVEAPDA